jgi:hypothetical protein
MILTQSIPAAGADLPTVSHYALNIRFDLADQRIKVVATLVIRNTSDESFTRLPVLLYRLLTVGQVVDRSGMRVPFTQEVVPLKDVPQLQVNRVIVDLPAPLRPHDSVAVTMVYEGYVLGYSEVMEYLKDKIDEEYSILRPDVFAFPAVAEPTFVSVLATYGAKFTWSLTATVPSGYRVACGGILTDSATRGDSSTFVYRSKIPTWRIDCAAARFAVLGDQREKLLIFHLPADSIGARRVLEASRNVIRFYSSEFGRPKHYEGYTVIEIPEGWGSQAGDFYFLQTAAAFRDSTRLGEVYHEIGHSWNALASVEIQRCRWFDEAFASYFEALAIRAFNGETAFRDQLQKYRVSFVRRANQDREVAETPIAEYGKKEFGRYSYTKGAWSLYVLNSIVGDKQFASTIRAMLAEFDDRPINFEDFEKLCERIAGRDLGKFFREWIFGAESSGLLVHEVPIDEIVQRY